LGHLEWRLGFSVEELLDEHFDARPAAAVERIEVVTASPDEAQVLDVPAGSPLLAITRTTSDADGAPFEFSQARFGGDRIGIGVRPPGEPGASQAEPGGGRVI